MTFNMAYHTGVIKVPPISKSKGASVFMFNSFSPQRSLNVLISEQHALLGLNIKTGVLY